MLHRKYIPLVLIGLVILLAPVRGSAEDTIHSELNRLLTSEDYAGFVAKAQDVVAQDPGDYDVWFGLGLSHAHLEHHEKAMEAYRAALASPRLKSTALYNMACAEALGGNTDSAVQYLHQAFAAGFMDYDALETDPDLRSLRPIDLVEGIPAQNYKYAKGRNGVKVGYSLRLPENYDKNREYPAMVAYAPGGMAEKSADWFIDAILADAPSRAGWIVLVLLAPEKGWMTHPSHHALEDLLRQVQADHKIKGDRFHALGYAGGARPAATYALMSEKYFSSLTTVSAWSWSRWDGNDFSDFRGKQVTVIDGQEDSYGLQQHELAVDGLKAAGARVNSISLPAMGYAPAELRGEALFAQIVAQLP